MKKSLLAGLLSLLLLLSSCAPAGPAADDGKLHILTTTYPIYLFTTAVTQGVEGVQVDLLVNQKISCLHNYTLTVADMKAIEAADVIVMNGLGLEDFMTDALEKSSATVIDASTELFADATGDPHHWMHPLHAVQMMGTIASELRDADQVHKDQYVENARIAGQLVDEKQKTWNKLLGEYATSNDSPHFTPVSGIASRDLITFHDGFSYFAAAFGLNMVKAIEEEEGAETSAAEISEIVALIGEKHIPAIFTEKNGSTATADAISRECGVKVYQLDMLMSGDGTGIEAYLAAMDQNMKTIAEALA